MKRIAIRWCIGKIHALEHYNIFSLKEIYIFGGLLCNPKKWLRMQLTTIEIKTLTPCESLPNA